MKITTTIRRLYNEQLELNELLMEQVQSMEAAKRPEWFFLVRIKQLESYSQKLETGRVADPSAMEDFLACTVVVENRASIGDAVAHVERFCDVQYTRPRERGVTHKPSECFPFDDFRMYVKLKADPAVPQGPVHDVVFEVQIKTFLQHAWSIATHDLVYKGTNVDWSRARVAFQIKAMLEHAEVSIEKVNEVAASSSLAMSDRFTSELREILDWLASAWEAEQLPKDRVRLAQTIWELAKGMNIQLSDVREAVETDTVAGDGTRLVNLSPYGVIVRALSKHRRDELRRFVRRRSGDRRPRLFVTPEMEVEDVLSGSAEARIVRVF
jgi:ppGpp synthetase/RelA/SpoT-type nucleotidyltranferase